MDPWTQADPFKGGCMSYGLYDTDWAVSSKGNHWKRINGKVATAGRKKDGKYWAMADGIFADGTFYTINEAMAAAEARLQYLIRSRGF
jgi:hypothetical protein